MKERKIDNPPCLPSEFKGEEYPHHFHFYEIQDPEEGEVIGWVEDFIPDINEQGKNLPRTELVWKCGCVNQVSKKDPS